MPLTPEEKQAWNDTLIDVGADVIDALDDVKFPGAKAPRKAPAGATLAEMDDARARTLDAHEEWLKLGEELPRAVRQTKHLFQIGCMLSSLAGFAIGFGVAVLVLRLVSP